MAVRARTRRFALPALLMLLLPACGDDGVAPEDLAGTWRGQSQQGRTISFAVSGGEVTSVEVGFLVNGTACTIEGEIGGPFSAAIDDGEFTVRITGIDPSVTLNGTFTSSSRATGTVQFSTSQCGGTASSGWTATKQ